MKIKKIFIIIIPFLLFSCSQSFYLKKANKQYSDNNYINAKINYEKAISKSEIVSDNDKKNIANTYFKIKDYNNALKYYAKIDIDNRDFQTQLNYANILQFNKDFAQAKQAYIDLKLKPNKIYNDSTIDNFIESCELVISDKKPKYPQYILNKTSIDVQGESFGLTFYNEGVLYSAPVPIVLNYVVNEPYKTDKYGNVFKNLYFSKISEKGDIIEQEKFDAYSNDVHHIGSVCYLPDSSRLYFSETIKENGKAVIKIFSLDKVGDEYKNKTELPFNSNSYSCAHPSISQDGNQLFFTSDMKGGFGGKDIYVSNFFDGKWTKPQNLGKEVNTEADEMFPFIKTNGVLYFSSNGKVGYGGLDIYYALYSDGRWTHIVHKDMPLNSYADDFAFTENPKDKTQIYISSNRNSKPGIDNIYFVKKQELPPDTIKGRIYDDLTGKSIGGATLCLLIDSISGDTIAKAYTDDDGNYSLIVPKKLEEDEEERLFTVIKKDGYEDKIIDFEGRYNDTDRPPFRSKDVAMKVEIKKEQVIEFHNIYFDFGKADLKPSSIEVLDKLIQVMNDNESMVIELSAHTDSKSSKKYNQKLSNKRADSAKTYMVSKGIDSKRIVAKGYGETKLLNRCKDGVECSDEEHAMNRRIEVKVLSIN